MGKRSLWCWLLSVLGFSRGPNLRRRHVAFAIVLVGSPVVAGVLPGGRGTDRAAAQPHEGYELLRATQEAFHAITEDMRRYLVRIETVGGSQPHAFMPTEERDQDAPKPRRLQNPFREDVGSRFVLADGPTTGIIYSADGYIITSSFNFIRDPILISATLADGRRLVAELVARDQVRKIALLKVDASSLPVPRWADPRDVSVGQWAIALGLGFGGELPAVTVGIISAHNRMHGNAIQTDAKLSPANYGGPVCDLHGRVVGIAVPMAQRPGELAGIDMYDSGVGFVIPKPRVDEIVAVLRTGKSVYRGWLGIQLDPEVRDAVVVGRVAIPSPVHAAGIEAGDIILEAEGKPIRHFGHLVQALYMIPAGDGVHLHLKRGDREFDKVVTLARNTELGPLPEEEEPFDPSEPTPE